MAPNLVDCVIHWKKKLDKNPDEDTILCVIRRLSKIPITVEILEATHIGKSIRNLSKRDDIVGEKAKTVLNKWRNIFVNLESAKNSKQKSISNKDNVEKSSCERKEKYKKNSFSQSSSKQSFEKHLDTNHSSKSSRSLAEFEKKKFDANDVNFHHFIEASVSPKISSDDEKRKSSSSTDSQAVSSGKRKLTTKEKVEAYMNTIPKKFKLEGHSDSPEKKKHAVPVDEDEMLSHSFKKEKSSSSHSKKEKSSKVAESETSKSKVNAQSADGFTSSSVSFEDCLGFNDIVTVTKKKSSKSQSSTKKNDSDSIQSKNKIGDKKVTANSSDKKMTANSSNKKMSCEVNNSKKSSRPSKEKQSHSVPKKSTIFDPPKVNSPSLSAGQSSLKWFQNQNVCSSQKDSIRNEDVIKFTSSRKEKTAIYSGRKICNKGVPTLTQCCYRVLIENIDILGEIDMEYELLKPILEKCTPNQLMMIEKYNPQLLDETHELWEMHCKRDYKLLSPLEHETWRDVYLRGFDEREERLRHITANISASMLKATPVRQVKLAFIDSYVKPPREVLRRQARSGFVDSELSSNVVKPGKMLNPKVNPKKAETVSYSNASNHSFIADKRDKIKTSESLHIETPHHFPSSKGNAKSVTPVVDLTASDKDVIAMSLAAKKPKVAPLMAKTLKTMKQCFRR